ncbi:MAG: OOP family OmpA-OmpF porin, partial [Patiriisocius sp.]
KTEVHIISKYSAIENFETPNIGIQRGNEIKNLLTTLGIDSTRVIVKSSIEEIKFSTDNSYSNAIGFEFKHLNEDHIALVTPEITAIPEVITFYPRISDSGILKSKKLDELVETVINIFEEDPTIKITIVGHTDNSGTANENYNRGLNYAKDVRWYLVTKGKIDRLKIKVSSKGDVEPLRSNRTRNGRSANKRVELLIE